MKLYHKDYKPTETSEKPATADYVKTLTLEGVKTYMADNRGYLLKELVEVAQAELHSQDIHMRDDEVAAWIIEMDKSWGWHEPKPVDVEK